MFKKILLMLMFTFCFYSTDFLVAQEDEEIDEWNDTTEIDEWDNDTSEVADEWEEEWDQEWQKDWKHFPHFDFWNARDRKPTINILYGVNNKIDLKPLTGAEFEKPGIAEVRIGYTELEERKSYLAEYDFSHIFVSSISTRINDASSVRNLEGESWRFGFGDEEGYAYKYKGFAFIPYNGTTMQWSRLSLYDAPGVGDAAGTETDRVLLNDFDNTIRFGTSAEAGLRVQLIPNLSVFGAYERSAIFRRHLFWKQTGSYLIEQIGYWLSEEFVDEVMETSPYVTPVLSFLLKGGISYAMYELREEKMAWPFNSEPPLMYDTFKFGVSFAF